MLGATGVNPGLIFQAPGTGAVARTYQQKFGDVINAADYGALCNGSDDDTAIINAALTYAGTSAPATARLPLTGQMCMVLATLNVPAGVTLQSAPSFSAGL